MWQLAHKATSLPGTWYRMLKMWPKKSLHRSMSHKDNPAVIQLQHSKRNPWRWRLVHWHTWAGPPRTVTILLNQQRTIFMIDTGTQCNVIPYWKYYQMCKDPLQPSSSNLIAFGRQKLHTCGKAKIPCQHNGNHYLVKFEVIDHTVPNILGLVTCIEMNPVQCIETVNNHVTLFDPYYNVYEGQGCVTDVSYHIRIDPNQTPVIHSYIHLQGYRVQSANLSVTIIISYECSYYAHLYTSNKLTS